MRIGAGGRERRERRVAKKVQCSEPKVPKAFKGKLVMNRRQAAVMRIARGFIVRTRAAKAKAEAAASSPQQRLQDGCASPLLFLVQGNGLCAICNEKKLEPRVSTPGDEPIL